MLSTSPNISNNSNNTTAGTGSCYVAAPCSLHPRIILLLLLLKISSRTEGLSSEAIHPIWRRAFMPPTDPARARGPPSTTVAYASPAALFPEARSRIPTWCSRGLDAAVRALDFQMRTNTDKNGQESTLEPTRPSRSHTGPTPFVLELGFTPRQIHRQARMVCTIGHQTHWPWQLGGNWMTKH
jgi:hypothetical protein